MTAKTGFNLLYEPWILALDAAGQEQPVSILDALEQAPRLAAIGGEVPTQAFAVTRLLLAFLHRALDGPDDQAAWQQLWDAEDRELPMDEIRCYAGRVRHRFDLFDTTAPFFQVADLQSAKNEVSGLEKIVADVPNGHPLFTTRSAESLRRVLPAEAARWLVHVQAFDPSGIKTGAVGDPRVKGGKGYPIGPGWSGQIGGVLPEGRTLRETLLLNLIAQDAESYVRLGGDDDVPPWEREADTPAGRERPPRGAIDLYTWQTRRVRLLGDRGGVTGVVLANGDKIAPQNRHGLDPHTAWRYSQPQSKKLKTDVYMPRRHDPNRSVWRGIGALLPSISPRHHAGRQSQPDMAPGVLQWISDLVGEEVLAEDYVPRIRVLGVEYGSQNATYSEIIDDTLPAPVIVLREDRPAAGQTATEAVRSDVEQVASALWSLAENVAQAAGAPAQSGAGDHARQRLYASLDRPYRRWLGGITPGRDLIDARREWQCTVHAAALAAADEVIATAPPAAWRGRVLRDRLVNVPLADTWFRAALRKALPLAASQAQSIASEEEVGVG